MKIQKIIGENGVMPQMCGRGACPAAIIAEDGNIYVQGNLLAPEENSQLTAPNGEGFVKMPGAVFAKIARQVLNA